MSMWESERRPVEQDSDGNQMEGVVEVYFDAVTDANGEFSVDATALDFVEILEVSGQIMDQTLSALDSIVDKLTVNIVEVTTTVIKGVIVKPTMINVTIIGLSLAPVVRGGAGHPVKVKVKGIR